jgi:hypothetical protein
MYMTPYKCQVTGSNSTRQLATAQPPVWCEDDPTKCVKGSKQMVVWHQQTGNNIQVDGFDKSGTNKSPTYNSKLGFTPGGYTLLHGFPVVFSYIVS